MDRDETRCRSGLRLNNMDSDCEKKIGVRENKVECGAIFVPVVHVVVLAHGN